MQIQHKQSTVAKSYVVQGFISKLHKVSGNNIQREMYIPRRATKSHMATHVSGFYAYPTSSLYHHLWKREEACPEKSSAVTSELNFHGVFLSDKLVHFLSTNTGPCLNIQQIKSAIC